MTVAGIELFPNIDMLLAFRPNCFYFLFTHYQEGKVTANMDWFFLFKTQDTSIDMSKMDFN